MTSLSKKTKPISTKPTSSHTHLPIGIVDFKACIENSRIGKHERATFEEMKKKMNQALQEKQQLAQEINAKLNDADYLSSLSKQNEAELKHKSRMLSQELAQQEEQCYRALEQHNAQAMHKLQDLAKQAAEIVAQQEGLLMIINREALFYYTVEQDKTGLVLTQIDKLTAASA